MLRPDGVRSWPRSYTSARESGTRELVMQNVTPSGASSDLWLKLYALAGTVSRSRAFLDKAEELVSEVYSRMLESGAARASIPDDSVLRRAIVRAWERSRKRRWRERKRLAAPPPPGAGHGMRLPILCPRLASFATGSHAGALLRDLHALALRVALRPGVLRDGQLRVVFLAYAVGLDCAELSEALRISPEAVRNRLRRATSQIEAASVRVLQDDGLDPVFFRDRRSSDPTAPTSLIGGSQLRSMCAALGRWKAQESHEQRSPPYG